MYTIYFLKSSQPMFVLNINLSLMGFKKLTQMFEDWHNKYFASLESNKKSEKVGSKIGLDGRKKDGENLKIEEGDM